MGSAERLSEGELCCLGHKRKVSALCLLNKIYHRVNRPINEYLNNFVAARNTRASAALGELDLMIPRCGTDQFSRSFLSAVVHLWNLLPSNVFCDGTLSSFKSAMNLCLLGLILICLFLFQSLFAVIQLAWYHASGTVLVYRGMPFPNSMCQVILIIIIIIIVTTIPKYCRKHKEEISLKQKKF